MPILPETHITVSSHRGVLPFRRRDARVWLWRKLRALFPNALACVVMPDHFHLVIGGLNPTVPPALGRVLGQFQRAFFIGRPVWASRKLTYATPPKILGRLVIYIWLNPCAAALCTNPLYAEFSTYRDFVDATAAPWCTSAALASALCVPTALLRRTLPDRLAQDRRCGACADALLPVRAPLDLAPSRSVVRSVAVAAGSRLDQVYRAPALRLAALQLYVEANGSVDPRIADALRISRSSSHLLAAAPPSPILPAARICLAAPRLTQELAANERPSAPTRTAA